MSRFFKSEFTLEVDVEAELESEDDFSRAASSFLRVSATVSLVVLVSVCAVAVEDDALPGPDASLSSILAKVFWASVRFPDCRESDKDWRSLLNGSFVCPPFCVETSFCNVASAVWASVVLPDCRAAESALKSCSRVLVPDVVDVLKTDEVEDDESFSGGGGGAWAILL